jgi:hypothetical protein
MNEYYTSLRKQWDTEAFFAKDSEVWVNESVNLWYSAKVLYDQQWQWASDEETSDPYPVFWGHRVIRMLMGFAFENLIKAYLITEKGRDADWFRKEGNFKVGNKAHDLIWLFDEAEFSLSEAEAHYLGLIAMCSLWAGRYPIAANENAMPRKRESMSSSEALLKRSVKIREKYSNDPRVKYGDYWDLLHGGVGPVEYENLESVFKNLKEILCTQQVDPIVKTPADEVEAQGTQGHP